ncbi:MAG: Hsp20/alpha crystallin family protein [Thermomicrobiales bacterium]|nr:Hsp20/alpha crystallin family protein [Thermomicrobiales bacterium]
MSEQETPPTGERGRSLAPVGDQRPRRWEPATLLEEIQTDLSRLLELGPFGTWPLGRALRRMPAMPLAGMPRVDVFEREGALVVKAELPGIKKEDIDLEIVDGDLVLRAERREEREVNEENWYRMERNYGSLYRRLPLPEDVQTEQIQAALTDGVLEVTIPKPPTREPQVQRIAIAESHQES